MFFKTVGFGVVFNVWTVEEGGFDESSSIPDRVRTIAMFGNLNTVYLHNNGPFNRGTFFFRPTVWSREEMYQHCLDIAERSILYYLSKYGKTHFQQTPSITSFEG